MTNKKSKRLKTVFKNMSELATKFVERSQEYGNYKYTCGGRFSGYYRQKGEPQEREIGGYFQNNRLYSFGSHYLLAVLDLNINGKIISLVNFQNYSRTTQSHSYDVRHSIRKSKRDYIEICLEKYLPSGNIDYLNSEYSEKDLKNIVLEQVKENCFNFCEEIFQAQFVPWSCVMENFYKKQIKEHNKLALALGLKKYLVNMPKDLEKDIRAIDKLDSKATRDFNSRRQTRFFNKHEWMDSYRGHNDDYLLKL